MKHAKHIGRAAQIGADSWELLAFTQLRANASAASQIRALTSDEKWIRDHTEEVCARIDLLIKDIEASA
ncbi:MAG TPA: hypothetical protein VMY35_05995 [Phycisphaerae bacterium]|nr:hypothetical protein [Phycisphaerae bacterium]